MRIFEIVGPKLFLFTNSAQPVGKTVSLNDAVCDLGPEIEDRLERMRPEDQPSRSKTIRLSTAPRACEFVYAVQPTEGVTRNHLGWIKMLGEADPTQEGVLDHIAQGYWSGQQCKEARNEEWECRSARVTILKRIGRSGSEQR